MNTNRINQITASLEGLGTSADALYTNQEIIDRLKELQAAMMRGIYEKTHAENLRDRDIMLHFEALAKEYRLESTETYRRFAANMTELGYTIGSLIKGMNGERIARRALKLLSYEKGVRILYNVQLEDADAQAEYDAIVIAPYGLFVIEVKNWGCAMHIAPNGLLTRDDSNDIVYDLPGRMSVKEALLREYLKELFPTSYHSMLLLSNERAQIRDEYHKIPVNCGGGIAYEIKEYADNGICMTSEQTAVIADRIVSNHKVQRSLCGVKCEEIIADYAHLMVMIEEAATGLKAEDVICDEIETVEIMPSEDKKAPEKSESRSRRWDWIKRNALGIAAAGVAAVFIPTVISAALNRRV